LIWGGIVSAGLGQSRDEFLDRLLNWTLVALLSHPLPEAFNNVRSKMNRNRNEFP
jgi:hypothetical protein